MPRKVHKPQCMWRIYFARDDICIFPEMSQNRTYSISVLFPFSNRSRAFFSRNAPFLCSFFLKCPIFSFSIIRWENWGISGRTNIKKGHFEKKKHVIDLKTGKAPKLNIFDFGAFQEKCICHHVQNISSTYILGHLKKHPVSPPPLSKMC